MVGAIRFMISVKGTKAQRFFQKSLKIVGLRKFRVKRARDGMVYSVDMTKWLKGRSKVIMERVNKRI